MINFCNKHEKVMVVLGIVIALVVLAGSIAATYASSRIGYTVVIIGMVLSAALRSFTKLIPVK